MAWNGWPLERILLLSIGLFALIYTIQTFLYHYRQNFSKWSMWLPVITTPIVGLFAILLAFANIMIFQLIFLITGALGLVSGLYGTYVHFKGIGARVNGYTSFNFIVGPPIILPTVIVAMSSLGLLALYWGW